ncbi:MAG: aromatic ring-hydroxylating dioxygenase subunit alpha [Myxococcota bacterium]|nr:aromatic ring-hydroxylating dioxygenase subunit alpha [Myxococcota bacterium]MDW8363915.1 aromatic ring-hydroxylating dioxygenase subunit alpha [Myxococcales bacterium]
MIEPVLVPPPTRGRTSVARVVDDWYPVASSRALGRRPLGVTLLGSPLVLFRDDGGRPHALLDRCPHRNAPLSAGVRVGETIRCPYHGWRFDGKGECREVPGLVGEAPEHRGRRVPAFATREQDGLVWVWGQPDSVPAREPFRFPWIGERGYTTVRARLEVRASLHAVAENALDVPHTAFLHAGLFRRPDRPRQRLRVTVRRWHDRVEAEYTGEARPSGWLGRLLAPRGGVVEHWDRFFLPGIVQVEYRLGRAHLCVTAALSPVTDFHTRLFAAASFRLPWLPGWLVALVVRPIALRVFRQDAALLERQRAVVERFGGEHFVSTDLDVLGPAILHLLRDAERGHRGAIDRPVEKSVEMLV